MLRYAQPLRPLEWVSADESTTTSSAPERLRSILDTFSWLQFFTMIWCHLLDRVRNSSVLLYLCLLKTDPAAHADVRVASNWLKYRFEWFAVHTVLLFLFLREQRHQLAFHYGEWIARNEPIRYPSGASHVLYYMSCCLGVAPVYAWVLSKGRAVLYLPTLATHCTDICDCAYN